nr:MAG TPA: hypothetical protein [Caudoviricetes sp.]
MQALRLPPVAAAALQWPELWRRHLLLWLLI